jgi:transglutaminase/protease-like cytokinesis protein 3
MSKFYLFLILLLIITQVQANPLSDNSIIGSNKDYINIRNYISQIPVTAERSTKSLAKYLVKGAKTETQLAYAIFYWLTQNIAYDTQGFLTGNQGDLSPSGVLHNRKAICSGYSALFVELAKQVSLEAVEISGVTKSYTFFRKGTLGKHSWNAIKINGQWRLLDATWGAGYMTNNGKFKKELDNFHFFTPPEHFISRHFPENSQWQLLNPTISKKEFKRLVHLNSTFFKYKLALDSHKQELISVKNELTLTLVAPDNVVFTTSLSQKNGQELSDSLTFSQRKDNRLVIKAIFPHQGKFDLTLFAKDKAKSGNYSQVLKYVVQASQSPTEQIEFPQTFGRFKTSGAYLYIPMIYQLKSGQTYQFKIKVPGASKVAVVNGKNWHHLDNHNQTFSGSVPINSGKIRLFAKFPDKSNYSGLVQFKGK